MGGQSLKLKRRSPSLAHQVPVPCILKTARKSIYCGHFLIMETIMHKDMHTILEVLSGASLGYSLGEIQKKTGIPKSTAKRILDRAKEVDIDFSDISTLSQEAIESLFLPKRRTRLLYEEPAWETIYLKHEKPRRSINLRVLWEEYSKRVIAPQRAMGYSSFCKAYEAYKGNLPASLRDVSLSFQWDPGDVVMIDYSGDPLHYKASDGRLCRAQIFVGVLAYSNFIFCTATPDQTRNSWITACVKMLEYFSAVPHYVYLDNSTSLVLKADLYEPKVCDEFRALAAYYGFTPFPVRPGKPKDKAMVEGAVRICQENITNPLSDSQFLSLEDVNAAIAKRLEELNQKPVHERLGTRRELLKEELTVMQPLPIEAFEPSMLEKKLKVRKDYQIRLNNRRFSVPYQYAGKEVRIRLWPQKGLLICYDIRSGKEITRHNYDESGKLQNTLIEHMPPNHVAVMRSKDNLLDSIRIISPKLWELAQRITRNQPLRVARRILSGMLANANSLGGEASEEVAKAVLERAEPSFEAFRQEVDKRFGLQQQEIKIGRGVTLITHQSKKNLRGASYYAKRLKEFEANREKDDE